MKLTQIFSGIIILLILWDSEAASTYYNRHISRKQKKVIEGSMDLQADPCDDFYKYACGNWDQVYPEAGLKYYESISLLDYKVNQEMSRVFNRFRMRNKPKFLNEAHTYYKSCKNLKRYKAKKYLVWLKTNDNFKWPALWTPAKNTTQFNWVQMLAKMRTFGFNEVLIQQIFMPKISDVKTFVIDLDKPVADGGFNPLTKESLTILMESLPAQLSIEELDQMWQEIENFELKLQELDNIEDFEVDTIVDYEKVRLLYIKDLPFEWLTDYLKIILNQTELNDKMRLYIQNIPYMEALDELLSQYSQRFICKYLEVRFLWYLHRDRPATFIEEDCLSSTRSLMPTAMHWQYEQLHPELQDEYASIYEIFNDIRKHFNSTVIKNKHGFNASVIQYLQKKITHMELRLNNIPRIDTLETLEKFYQPLNLDVENFYENHLKLLRFSFLARRNLLSSQTPVLDSTYQENSETGSSSSPYFMESFNTVFVPLSLLQHPIYSPGLDDVYKYSSLGFLLAHEMFHGFDDSGLFTDANGCLSSVQFEENPLFNASLNCLQELNPNVVSEKIADTSGLRYAYQAYFDTNIETPNKTIYLYGNEFTLNKLFFLNFAQFFCGKSAEEFISTSAHGSDRARITDALSHFPEFSKEFKCNSNHQLYPHETCHLWR